MPALSPFRALRFDPAVVGELSNVICPPYDVISRAERGRLLARDLRNVVRVELPVAGDATADGGGASEPRDPADAYAGAAETLADWQRRGVLRLDAAPALYAYEATYRLRPDVERVQRGFFARLGLESLGDGIRPHERTLSAPKEDRLRLLRATRVNTSPIVLLADPAAAPIGDVLAAIARRAPDIDATDDAGVRHRVWLVPSGSPAAEALLDAGRLPLTIADGHHRYETALTYSRETARPGREPSRDAPADHVLALVLDGRADGGVGPLILPTHRLILDEGAFQPLWSLAHEVGTLTRVTFDEAANAFSPPFPARPGRIGLLSWDTAWLLDRERPREDDLFDPTTTEVVRSLDVALVEAMLRRSGVSHVRYTHEAGEARDLVRSSRIPAAVLVAPTPIGSVLAVAAAGALMPQKSTYFYPKVATGLVMDPLG